MASALLVAALPAGTSADEKPDKPAKPATPLKVQVVLNRHEGEKKVGSWPYTLSLNADDGPARTSAGIMVPVKYQAPESQGNVVYKSVGNTVECRASSLADGRFKVACTVEQSTVEPRKSAGSEASALVPPVLRSFKTDGALILRDGQTAQFLAGSDPANGETLKVDVTLNLVRE
jgi:hypothetical protein